MKLNQANSKAVFKAVLFDLDATLIDTGEYILLAFNHALASEGIAPIDYAKLASLAGHPLRDCYAELAPGKNAKRLCDVHMQFQYDNAHLVKEFPGADGLLKQLNQGGVKVGIVTARYRKSTDRLLEELGLAQYCQARAYGDDAWKGKPHPEPFLETAKMLGERPGDCLVVGDGCADIVGGKEAGCKTCRALYGYGGMEACVKSDFEVSSIGEVSAIVFSGPSAP